MDFVATLDNCRYFFSYSMLCYNNRLSKKRSKNHTIHYLKEIVFAWTSLRYDYQFRYVKRHSIPKFSQNCHQKQFLAFCTKIPFYSHTREHNQTSSGIWSDKSRKTLDLMALLPCILIRKIYISYFPLCSHFTDCWLYAFRKLVRRDFSHYYSFADRTSLL